MNTTAITAHADQLAAEVRDRRCCDALAPCDRCRVARTMVQVSRKLATVPKQRTR
jgi:hypothetical protein